MSADSGQQAGSNHAAPEGFDSWKDYWTAQGMPWRTESEIDGERQRYLAERRALRPDIEQGIYPFRDENGAIKLTRADVEWLLATHESRGLRGPVDWHDETQREREGLDLRGADLRDRDLRRLPLTAMRGGPTDEQLEDWLGEFYAKIIPPWPRPSRYSLSVDERLSQASTGLERAVAATVHLEGANLTSTHLEDALLTFAYLEYTTAQRAHFERAHLNHAGLAGADLREAHLEGAQVAKVAFAGADLTEAHLEGAVLRGVELGGKGTEVETLPPATLQGAHLSSATQLNGLTIGDKTNGYARLADVHWHGVNLGVVDWSKVAAVGEEADKLNRAEVRTTAIENLYASYEEWGFWLRLFARLFKPLFVFVSIQLERARQRSVALRACRQLSVALRGQGLNEAADRFAYRARRLQREAQWREAEWGRAFGSWLLDLVAGYGYKPMRSVITYLLVILSFAAAYFALTNFALTPFLPSHSSPLAWYEAIVLSISSFHGRGLFPSGLSLGDPIAILAAGEAIIGLLIEITFIATFTQRFFAH